MELRKRIRENIGHGLYALYNTVLVSGIDIPIMKSVTDWNFVNSSGLIYVYNAVFTGIRLLPPILLYLKNKSKLKFVKYLQTFFITAPFQDAFFYGVQGMNPISPFENTDWCKPFHYPWGNMQVPVKEYFTGSMGAAGIVEMVKRKTIKKG